MKIKKKSLKKKKKLLPLVIPLKTGITQDLFILHRSCHDSLMTYRKLILFYSCKDVGLLFESFMLVRILRFLPAQNVRDVTFLVPFVN